MTKKHFKDISQEFVDESLKWMKEAESIVISSHKSPDDDSISSCLAMYYFLTSVLEIPTEKVHMIYTGEKTDRWSYFENYDKIKFVDDIYNYLKPKDLLILLDGSGWHRFSKVQEINKFAGKTICIDHHPTPDDKFDLHLQATRYSACAELVYRLFLKDVKLSKRICETILLGILGDTGNFRYIRADQTEIFTITQKLVQEGEITIEALQSKYSTIDERVYLTLLEIMKTSEIKEIKGWPRFVIAYLPKNYKDKYLLADSEITDASMAFTPYLKEINGVEWGMVATPRSDKMCHFSLRSIPNSVSVRMLVEQMKIGGGHDRAAGGKVNKADPQVAISVILDWMTKNRPVIN